MNTTATLDAIRDQIVPLLQPYASRIEIFGSVARGDDTPDSDLDILVRLRPDGERPRLGLRWFELEDELAERLGRPVEMVTERALSRHIRPLIESDRRALYEDEWRIPPSHSGRDSPDRSIHDGRGLLCI